MHGRNLTFVSDVDYVRGIHSWRGGVQVYADWYRANLSNNYHPGPGGLTSPANTYVLGNYKLNKNVRYSGGIDQRFSPRFSGVMTSPFFMTATGVQNPRKVDMGINIAF